MDVDVKWGRKGEIVIAMLVGRFSSANAALFERLLENGVDSSDDALILDFENVTFLSSAGLRVALTIAKKFNGPGKKFGICALREGVRGIVEVSGFDKVIPVYDSQVSAVEAFESA
ncbi:MAG: STAS domain-containing protein [Deltaproteobacteria bacterium]|nr:STAS domain-containing protein [Deltaproteobacteria bacterium]